MAGFINKEINEKSEKLKLTLKDQEGAYSEFKKVDLMLKEISGFPSDIKNNSELNLADINAKANKLNKTIKEFKLDLASIHEKQKELLDDYSKLIQRKKLIKEKEDKINEIEKSNKILYKYF